MAKDWQGYLPDPAAWPEELALAVARGEYAYLHHNKDWLILLSIRKGHLVEVQAGGAVQARLAVNRATGEIFHPTPKLRIEQWQADLMGYGEQYRQARERPRTTPSRQDQREPVGEPKVGIPKGVQP